MMLVRILSLLLFLLLSFSVRAEDLLAPAQAEAPPPDIQNLAADWWQYFENASPEERPKRVEELLGRLGQLPAQTYGAWKSKIEASLQTWQNSKSQQNQPIPTEDAPQKQETYSIAELLALNYHVQEYANDLSTRREQLRQLEQVNNRFSQQLQTIKIRYLQASRDDPKHLDSALEWINLRFQEAASTNEYALRQKTIRNLETQYKRLQDLFSYAQEHLLISPDSDESSGKALQQAKSKIQQLRDKLEQAHSTMVTLNTSSDEGRAQNHLQTLKALEVELQLADARLTEMRLQTTYYLQIIFNLLENSHPDFKQIREFIHQSDSELKQLDKDTPRWQEQLDNERGAANIAMLSAMETTEADSAKLLKLTGERQDTTDRLYDIFPKLGQNIEDNRLLLNILQEQTQKAQGGARAAVSVVTDTAENVVQFSLKSLQKPLFEINETPITTISIIRFLLILLIAWIISGIMRGTLRKIATRRGEIYSGPLFMVRRVLHYIIIIIGFLIGLSSIGIDVSKFALIATAFSIGIGFGLQTLINNFVSGIILLFEKSIKIGDFVELESGVTGEVREMRVRSTVITTNDNIDIVVPNSEFVGGRVVNWTMSETHRRIRIPFGVAYGVDKELVRKVILEAADKVPYTLRHAARKPQVWLVSFGDNSLNFELVVWLTSEAVKRPGSVNAHYCWEIETALSKHGIEIPFPQRDLHIRSAPALLHLLEEWAKKSEPK